MHERCRFCKDRGWLLPRPSVFADAATVFEEEEVCPVALADGAAFSTDAEAVRARLPFFLRVFRLRQGGFELSALGDLAFRFLSSAAPGAALLGTRVTLRPLSSSGSCARWAAAEAASGGCG